MNRGTGKKKSEVKVGRGFRKKKKLGKTPNPDGRRGQNFENRGGKW